MAKSNKYYYHIDDGYDGYDEFNSETSDSETSDSETSDSETSKDDAIED